MSVIIILILYLVLAIAISCDVRTRKIPNQLVVVAAAVGLGASLTPDGIGLAQSAGGLALGFALLLPLYWLRTLGAGDVKLMAALGTFLGIEGSIVAVLATLVAGGVLAIAVAWRKGSLGGAVSNVRNYFGACVIWLTAGGAIRKPELHTSASRLPYSIAIGCGVTAYMAIQYYFNVMSR